MNMHSPSTTITIRHERAGDEALIEALAAAAFGPGRFARAAFRLREGVASDPALCFVAQTGEEIAGSVKLTPILIGDAEALLLGPLVVDPARRSLGIGRELMNRALHAARLGGHRYVLLVGDESYYGPFGFRPVGFGRIRLPAPADPARILGCELVAGAAADYSGTARRMDTRTPAGG